MAGHCDDLAAKQAIHVYFIEWLEATGREYSNFNGVLFARQVTNQGQRRFEGMTDDEICGVIGCDRHADV